MSTRYQQQCHTCLSCACVEQAAPEVAPGRRFAAFPACRLQEQMISNFSDLLHPKSTTCFEQIYLDSALIICYFPWRQPWAEGDAQQGCCVPATGDRAGVTRTGWSSRADCSEALRGFSPVGNGCHLEQLLLPKGYFSLPSSPLK